MHTFLLSGARLSSVFATYSVALSFSMELSSCHTLSWAWVGSCSCRPQHRVEGRGREGESRRGGKQGESRRAKEQGSRGVE